MTAIYTDDFVIRNCIAWNEAAYNQADRDARNSFVNVPPSATKRLVADGKTINVRLSTNEYRLQRRKDAERHTANCAALDQLLGRQSS